MGMTGCGQNADVKTDKTDMIRRDEDGGTSDAAGQKSGTEKVPEYFALSDHKLLYEGNMKRAAVHDPSVYRDVDADGKVTYYVFGTHITSAKSADLVNWTVFTNGYAKINNTLYGDLSGNLSVPFAWAGENDSDCKGGFAVWAPDVIYNENYVNDDGSKGAYMIYFCTSSTYCLRSIKDLLPLCFDDSFL